MLHWVPSSDKPSSDKGRREGQLINEFNGARGHRVDKLTNQVVLPHSEKLPSSLNANKNT